MKFRNKAILLSLFSMLLMTAAAQAEFYNRAPDTLPGLLPEMRNPSYWIARMQNPDEVIMPLDDIQNMNERYLIRMKSPNRFNGIDPNRVPKDKDIHRWPGRFILTPDIYGMSPAALADVVKKEIGDDILFMQGNWMRDVEGLESVDTQHFGNMLGIEYADWELADFEREMAFDNIGSTVAIREAITVRDARLRVVPTLHGEHVGLMENGATRWDIWNVNIVRIGSPIQVLHTSRTGLYVFAMTDEGYGWISSEDIAFATKKEIDIFTGYKDFVVCTDDLVPYYIDESCTVAGGYFRMGDKLPIDDRKNSHEIIIPWRDGNGKLKTARAWLAEDANVHIGYLPYTRRNIVETGFRLLDNTYDWTMAWYGRNHETALRDLFACFGFNLPYNAELFTFYGDNTRVVLPDEGKDAQFRAILANEPFVTIQTCGGGHSQLFLGEYNGEPVVLDTHGYGYAKDGVQYQVRRMVVGEMSLPTYFLETPFTFSELIMK